MRILKVTYLCNLVCNFHSFCHHFLIDNYINTEFVIYCPLPATPSRKDWPISFLNNRSIAIRNFIEIDLHHILDCRLLPNFVTVRPILTRLGDYHNSYYIKYNELIERYPDTERIMIIFDRAARLTTTNDLCITVKKPNH